jgi:hypothetical protein
MVLGLRAEDSTKPEPLLARIKAVRGEGKGNEDAAAALKDLVALGKPALLPTLAAMPNANPLANNWLRPAADAIAEKLLADKELPVKELEAFVKDVKNSRVGRTAAYDWLVRADAGAPARLLPGMLGDPAIELRRAAVEVVLAEAEALEGKSRKAEATAAFTTAFDAARDADQVDLAAKHLKRLGVKADVAGHYGFIRSWKLVAPFDNVNGVGFEKVYAPEKGIEPGAKYRGKKGEAARWVDRTTTDPHGLVDLNKALGNLKGAVAYAYAVVDSPREQKIELRAGSITALKIYLNGKQVFGREEYHHGMDMDAHVGFGTLKKGKNEILVKVCQNEQTESWAQDWRFQLRLCDDLGAAVPFKEVTPAKQPDKKGEKE